MVSYIFVTIVLVIVSSVIAYEQGRKNSFKKMMNEHGECLDAAYHDGFNIGYRQANEEIHNKEVDVKINKVSKKKSK